ncbi:MAG: TorF family putative porin, partial [Casimicrobium sp.]
SGNIGVASSYIYRGLNQSDYKPAIQAGLDYSHASGFYVGAWGSSIRWLKDFGVSSGNTEIDLYAGYKGSTGDINYDVGVLRYEYTSRVTPGLTNPDTTELYVAGTYKWATLKYSHSLTNTFGVADSKNTYYVDLTAAIPVIDNVTLTLHAGYQGFKGPNKDLASYTDGKIAATYDFGNGATIEGGVTGTDADKNAYTPFGKKFTGKTTPYLLLKYSKTF